MIVRKSCCLVHLPGAQVTVIDANSPADVLESFHVCSSHLLCISSVPGAMEDDYKVDEELNKLALAHNEEDDPEVATGSDAPGVDGPSGIGAVSFVSCATGQEEVAKEDEEEKGELRANLYVAFSLFLSSYLLLS